jgi:putative transposase
MSRLAFSCRNPERYGGYIIWDGSLCVDKNAWYQYTVKHQQMADRQGMTFMPRTARKTAENGIYHVMVRGINRQRLFECEDDYRKYLAILAQCGQMSGFSVYAYCLMDNHVHLLIRPRLETLETAMKRIGIRYAAWFNKRYERTGHLFQDRYASELIDSDEYFMTVLRYIHWNPVKGGLAENVGEYKYDSFSDYCQAKPGMITDTAYAQEIAPGQMLTEYLRAPSDDQCLDIGRTGKRLSDQEAWRLIRKITGCLSTSDIAALDIPARDRAVAAMKKQGLSIRQINRLTGISIGIIRK